MVCSGDFKDFDKTIIVALTPFLGYHAFPSLTDVVLWEQVDGRQLCSALKVVYGPKSLVLGRSNSLNRTPWDVYVIDGNASGPRMSAHPRKGVLKCFESLPYASASFKGYGSFCKSRRVDLERSSARISREGGLS